MTASSAGAATAAVVLLAALQGAAPAGSPDTARQGAACMAEATLFFADARARRGESQAARDSLLDALDALDRRHRDTETDCAARLWEQRAILEMLSDRYDRLIDVATRFEASPVAGRLPDVRARMLGNRALAYYSLGATTQADEDVFRSAALARHLAAPVATTSLAEAAESAALRADWRGADAYIAQAHALLRDSVAARPVLRYALGRLSAAEAGLLVRRLHVERDSAIHRATAERLDRVAATAAEILRPMAERDDVQGAYDRGDLALALTDGAYAAALLGRPGDARQRLARASALYDDAVLDHYPGAALDGWATQWTTEALVGDTAAAVATARRTRYLAADLEDVEGEARALEALAGFQEASRDWRAAEQTYEAALRLRDVQWERNRLHDWSASAFAAAQAPYRGLARLYARDGRVREALTVLDASRARALRDLRAEIARRATLTPTQRARADSLLDEVQVRRLAALRSDGVASDRAAAAADVSRLQREIAQVTDAAEDDLAPLDVAALQTALREHDRALVSYLVDDDQSLAFVVTADTLVVRALPVGARDVERWMAAAGGPWGDREDAALHLAPLHRLHEALVRPLTGALPPDAALVVVPDGPLFDLPFGMLLEAPAEGYADAAFLIRRRPVSVELAASLVTDDAPRPRLGRPLVAFGRSVFGDAPRQWRAGGDALSDLPNVTREIERVGEHASAPRLAVDEAATEARLDDLIGDARIVHLASHAQPDPASPPLSRIYLWDDPDAPDDGVLHLYELQARDLHADLVVLSGCSTARGQAQPGEGTLSLQYGVRAAGARAALATLWPVDDRAMADVMDTLYAGLAEGLPKDRALQRAQVAYLDRHDGLQASPFFWASLVLSGDAQPVDLSGGGRLPWVLGGVLGAGALAWLATRRRHARRPSPAL